MKRRPEGDRIDDYVVEDHADHVLGTFKTQREAIDWAKKNGHSPLVARESRSTGGRPRSGTTVVSWRICNGII
jgi:hypothetical protein